MIETAPTATPVQAETVVSPEVVTPVQPATGRLGVAVRDAALPADISSVIPGAGE